MQIKLFKDIYDLREPVEGKKPEEYSIYALKKRDVVMIEAYIQRWQPSQTYPREGGSSSEDGDKGKKKWEPRTWDSWKVKFQLKKIYVLYSAPASGDAPGDVPDDGAI